MITYPLAIPGPLGRVSENLKKNNLVASSESPFTGSQQIQAWPGQLWELDLAWPEMTWAQFAALDAWTGALHGPVGTFLWGPSLATSPRGSGAGSPYIVGNAIGPRLATAGSNVNDGNTPWTNPNNVTSVANFASVTITLTTQSEPIAVTFGPLVPTSVTVVGIEVSFEAYCSIAGAYFVGQLNFNGPTSNGADVAITTSNAPYTLGGPTDLWGRSITPAMLNAGFSVNLWVANRNATFYVRNAQIKIYIAAPNQSGSNSILTSGWTPNANGILLPGDFYEIDANDSTGTLRHRLYQYIGQSALNADSSGAAVIDCYPALREVPTAGTALDLSNPQGEFRLAQNRREAPLMKTRTFSLSLKCREAI